MKQSRAIGLVVSIFALCAGLCTQAASAFPLPTVNSSSSCASAVDTPLPGTLDIYFVSLCTNPGEFSAVATSVEGLTFGAAVSQDALHGNVTLLLRQGQTHGGLGNELAITLHCGQLGPPCTLTGASSPKALDPLAIVTLDPSAPSVAIPPLGVHLPARSNIRGRAHRAAHRRARAPR